MTKAVGEGLDCSYHFGLEASAMAENNHPLAHYRAARKITQEALAKELHVSANTVWRWENGERTPRPKDAKRISSHTGISVGELIEAGAA
jgi:DNA-binding XRE family transcriptional regulator